MTDALATLDDAVAVEAPTTVPVTWWRRLLGRRLTDQERIERAAQAKLVREQAVQYRRLQVEAEACAATISETLVDLNVCYRYPKSERDLFFKGIKAIVFKRPFGLTEEALYLPVDLGPRARPRGVGIEHLKDPDVLRNLGVNVGRKVDFWEGEEHGFGFIIYRGEGMRAVPGHVKYDDFCALRPASADSLAIPVGMASGKRAIWRSLGQIVSMLVAGTTGGGKSNFLRAVICSLINTNSPRRLKIGLIDLKRGVEFHPFLELPHVLRFHYEGDQLPAVIDRREEVLPFLEWLISEGERRLDRLKEAKVVKIGQYNAKHRTNPMAHLVLIIDEWADIKLEPKIGAAAQEALINVASRFRAAGISVICCTQYPQKEVVSMRLKAVMPAKVAFSMPNMAASVMVLGNRMAYDLGNAPGRAVFQWGQENYELQVPFINNDTVERIIAMAKSGEHYQAEMNGKHDVTDEEVFEWAIRDNGGKLSWREMRAQFRGRGMTQPEAQGFAKGHADQLILVGASTYLVARPTSIGEAWRLLPVEEPADEPAPEPTRSMYTLKPDEFAPDEAQQAETLTDADLVEEAGLETPAPVNGWGSGQDADCDPDENGSPAPAGAPADGDDDA